MCCKFTCGVLQMFSLLPPPQLLSFLCQVSAFFLPQDGSIKPCQKHGQSLSTYASSQELGSTLPRSLLQWTFPGSSSAFAVALYLERAAGRTWDFCSHSQAFPQDISTLPSGTRLELQATGENQTFKGFGFPPKPRFPRSLVKRPGPLPSFPHSSFPCLSQSSAITPKLFCLPSTWKLDSSYGYICLFCTSSCSQTALS